MKRIYALIGVVLASTVAISAPFTGDTQGKVETVLVDHNYQRGYNGFLVYLTNVENDRWGCIAATGYIRVKDNALGVDQNNFKQMFSVALAAQISGARVGMSSSGTDPCNSVNQLWMIN